ncbi:hypothetical protein CAPTEDRAFT_218252 [Capitella teleta]|uniref:G-protein coupled receptors family 1 profile domain-containing protein n=1 Tax=Capitella teleta TaxID=283909 RepID=R7V4R3_CAPTE|nr:hypothetical protein CAPTEDRAFT_218252 [Capitella teleta]|eukprot:ELU13554.1 hypothetical protein CAPTEDRAFT_218252 [Capitella teleta]
MLCPMVLLVLLLNSYVRGDACPNGECSEIRSPTTEQALLAEVEKTYETTIDPELLKLIQYEKMFVTDRRYYLRTYERFALVLCPVGFICNGLSSVVFWRMKNRQKQAIILVLLALSIADPLATLVSTDYIIWATLGYSWAQNTNIGCKLIPYFRIVARDCSNVFCLLVAFERFISVYFPLQVSLWCTRKRMKIAIVCIFVMFAGLESYRIAAFGMKVEYGVSFCYRLLALNTIARRLDMAFSKCLGFVIPWLSMGILNFLIIIRLRKWRAQRASLGAKTDDGSDIGLTLMFLTMSLFSMAMNILDLVNIIVLLQSDRQLVNDYYTYGISATMMLCGHSCNFIFYAMGGETFRKTLMNVITCGRIGLEDPRASRAAKTQLTVVSNVESSMADNRTKTSQNVV